MRTAITRRELDVLRCSARGLGARATGLELHIAEGTVRKERATLLARLGVPNMPAAVHRGHLEGWL